MNLSAELPAPEPDQDKQVIGMLLRRVAQLEIELEAAKANEAFKFPPTTAPVVAQCPGCTGCPNCFRYYPRVTWTFSGVTTK